MPLSGVSLEAYANHKEEKLDQRQITKRTNGCSSANSGVESERPTYSGTVLFYSVLFFLNNITRTTQRLQIRMNELPQKSSQAQSAGQSQQRMNLADMFRTNQEGNKLSGSSHE